MGKLEIREDVPLGGLCTLGIGGPARHFATARSVEDVEAGLAWAKDRGHPLLVLGGGSNVVLSDQGFPGLVLHIQLKGVRIAEGEGSVEVTAAAGEDWDPLVALAVARGWAGLECLSGIPGLVGATPIQNVGAYGQEVRETLAGVDALDRSTGQVVRLANEDCGFGYRQSRFKDGDRDRFVVLAVGYRLRPGGRPKVHYAELQRRLAEQGNGEPSLPAVREAVLELRRRKSMVLDVRDPNTRSVGSFFMNPVVAPADFTALKQAVAAELGAEAAEKMPAFPSADGRVKLSAAWLIERAGLGKGYGRGRVGLSANHTLAIVNRGGAGAGEVVELAREIRSRVRERFGVTLAPEPVFVNLAFD